MSHYLKVDMGRMKLKKPSNQSYHTLKRVVMKQLDFKYHFKMLNQTNCVTSMKMFDNEKRMGLINSIFTQIWKTLQF